MRQFCASWYGALEANSGAISRMMSAAFSPIMIVGALRFPVVIDGMIEESTTLSPSTPMTRVSGSTTAIGSSGAPILQVHAGWYALST